MKIKNIVFAGHFMIGEITNQIQQATIEDAKNMNADLGIIVNDLDFARRLLYFQLQGSRGLIARYEARAGLRCGATRDICHIPTREEIEQRINTDIYEKVIRECQELEYMI